MRSAIAPVWLAGAVAACSGMGSAGHRPVQTKSIDSVLAAHTDSLMAIPGVVGTAIGLCAGEKCIKVYVTDSSPATRGRIPEQIEGFRVNVEVTGPFRAR